MRKFIVLGMGLVYGNAIVEAAHTIGNPSDIKRDQVALIASSTADTGANLPILDTILEGKAYPRPTPEEPGSFQWPELSDTG